LDKRTFHLSRGRKVSKLLTIDIPGSFLKPFRHKVREWGSQRPRVAALINHNLVVGPFISQPFEWLHAYEEAEEFQT
jgi:hypothetical protein